MSFNWRWMHLVVCCYFFVLVYVYAFRKHHQKQQQQQFLNHYSHRGNFIIWNSYLFTLKVVKTRLRREWNFFPPFYIGAIVVLFNFPANYSKTSQPISVICLSHATIFGTFFPFAASSSLCPVPFNEYYLLNFWPLNGKTFWVKSISIQHESTLTNATLPIKTYSYEFSPYWIRRKINDEC